MIEVERVEVDDCVEYHISKLTVDATRHKMPLYMVKKIYKDDQILKDQHLQKVRFIPETNCYLYCRRRYVVAVRTSYWIEDHLYWPGVGLLHRRGLIRKPDGERFSWRHHFRPFAWVSRLWR